MTNFTSKEKEIETDWFVFRSLRIRYGIRSGHRNTTPLVIFNGVGQSIEVLEPLITALPGIEVIVYDVPGAGLSDTPRLPWRYSQHAKLATALLDHLGYAKVTAMGISWGGPLAQQFTRINPDRVDKLVLAVSPPGNLMIPGKPGVYWRMAHVKRFTDSSYMRSIAGHIYGGTIRQDDSSLDGHMQRLQPPSRRGYLYQGLTMWGWTSLPWLSKLKQPTLIIQGEDDPMVPNANARLMACLLPNARLEFVDCGHMLILTRIPQISRMVETFMVA
jgi:poly(3-hydroxyalkanoate) depolymerase